MRPEVISIEGWRCRPGAAARLRDWAERTPGVEHVVIRDRQDGGIDAVLYVQPSLADVTAAVSAALGPQLP